MTARERKAATFEPAAYFRFFAGEARRTGSALYAALSEKIAGDEALLALAGGARAGQPPANLLFAAVHFLLLGGADHPLKDYYPSLGGARLPDGDVFAAFRDFAIARRAEIAAIVARRVVNTNEVGRAAALMPGLAFIAAAERARLALVELGPSAGLNLVFDRYHYRYLGPDGAVAATAFAPAPTVVEASLRSAPPPLPERPPAIASRLGLELHPVDLQSKDDLLWLKALVWPERSERRARLAAALALAAADPPEIRAGDAAQTLGEALGAAPPDAALVVFHSIFLYQVGEDGRRAIDAAIAAAARERPVWRLALEDANGAGRYFLGAVRRAGDDADDILLAETNPHGQWLDWRRRAEP